jgi:regulatory protein
VRLAELRGLMAGLPEPESQPVKDPETRPAEPARRRPDFGDRLAAAQAEGMPRSKRRSQDSDSARGSRSWGKQRPGREDEAGDGAEAGNGAGAGERREKKPVVDDRDPAVRAKDICLTLLTARPRTRTELKKALIKKEISEEVAEQVLGRLDDVGLIDDKAFAEMYVRSRHAYQGIGKRALSIELRRKGVDDDTAAEAVAAVDEEAEEDRARQLVRKRLPSMSSADHQAKIRRLVGMLARKGYSQGMAYRVVKDELATIGEETSLLDHPE